MEINIFAMNPRRKNSTTGKVNKKYNRGYAEPGSAEKILQMLGREDLPEMLVKIRNGEESLKEDLPFLCPHYAAFDNNHRAQKDILPETFTYTTCVDIDEKPLVEQTITKALKLNVDEKSCWYDMVLYVDHSARNKAHIWLRLPIGMTIEEAQRAFCQELEVPFDKSCITPERYIYMTGDEVYRSEKWLQPISKEELEERQEAFKKRGLDIDGRQIKNAQTAEISTSKPSIKVRPSDMPSYVSTSTAKVIPANDRTRFIVNECLKEARLDVGHLNTVGGIHNSLKSLLSVGATQLLSESELLGVLTEIMPEYWNDDDNQRLISDFYQKYNDPSQKMTLFQRQVYANSLNYSEQGTTDNDHSTTVTYGDISSLSEIYASKMPPQLPSKLPRLVKNVTSRTPFEMKPTVAQAMFPPLGSYPKNLSFLYIDGQYREPRINALIIADSSSGKDSSTRQPLNHICKDMAERDAISRDKLQKYNEECNAKASTKDKPERPTDIIIQKISPDITKARLSQCLAEAQGHPLYVQLSELEQWDRIEGASGKSNQFTTLKLTDDEDNPFGQDRAGSLSVSYSGSLFLNWNACTTPNKAQDYFRYVMTDGPIGRIVLGTCPYRGIGAPIPVYGKYDSTYDKALKPFIDNLKVATGQVTCKKAINLAKQLKDECAEFAMQTQDKVFDDLSHRALVHAFRKACILYAANDMKWENSIEGFCRWSLHYDLWLKMHFFGDQIRNAEGKVHTSRRGPQNLLNNLPDEFNLQDATNLRLKLGKSADGTRNMLNQWVFRKYVSQKADGSYKKLIK